MNIYGRKQATMNNKLNRLEIFNDRNAVLITLLELSDSDLLTAQRLFKSNGYRIVPDIDLSAVEKPQKWCFINLNPKIVRTNCHYCSRENILCKQLVDGSYSCDICLDDPGCGGYDHENQERMKQIKNMYLEFFTAGRNSDQSRSVKDCFNEYRLNGKL